jgi:hypothetical protein
MLLDNDFLTEQLMMGYTLPELAENWGVGYTWLNNNYNYSKKSFKYIIERTEITGKQESYYANEWQYGSMPTYNFNELSDREIKFYYENLKQQN